MPNPGARLDVLGGACNIARFQTSWGNIVVNGNNNDGAVFSTGAMSKSIGLVAGPVGYAGGNGQISMKLLAGNGTAANAGTLTVYGDNAALMTVLSGGNVGIGTSAPTHPLTVIGTISAKEVIVTSSGADYVFKPDYRLAPLSEVADYISANQHLPGIPSAGEVEKTGISLGEMQTKLLAKIEELTLHMIQAERQNRGLQQQNQDLQERISRLEGR